MSTSTLSKVLHLALKVENQLKRKQEAKKSTSYNDYYSKPGKGKKKKDFKRPFKSSQDPTPKPNSTTTMHDKPTSSQEPRTSSIKCFKCLGFGHIARYRG